MPDREESYFLRPDRILGAFIIPSSQRLARSVEAERALIVERAADVASNQRVRDLRHKMETSGCDLRSLHQGLYRKKRLGADEQFGGGASAATADYNTELDGDDGGLV